MLKKTLHIAFLFLVLWAAVLHAEVRVEITKGVDSIRLIGIVPFQWIGSGSPPEDISSIVISDLRNSGKFNPINLSNLNKSISQEKKTTFWTKLGIDIIISGQVNLKPDGNYYVTYQLINTRNLQDNILSKNSYTVNKKWLRYAGHTISDEIFERLIGIKGEFRTRIAYVVRTNHELSPYELRISDYDGYNQFIVYRSQKPLMSPSWSPDGSKLAYVTFESGHSALVVQTLSNGVIHSVASFPRHNGAPAFSPDGTKLAFALSKTGSLNLYVMELSSGQIRQITYGRNNNTEPSWFPDSQNLAFTSDQAGYPQVYKININSGAVDRITWEGTQNQDADVSSDGKFIVMVSFINGQQHITKQDLLSGNVKILSSTFLDENPSLSPSGTMVIYGSSRERGSVLNLVSTNGHSRACFLATDGQIKFPAWSPYL